MRFYQLREYEPGCHRLVIWTEEKGQLSEINLIAECKDEETLIRHLERPVYADVVEGRFPSPSDMVH